MTVKEKQAMFKAQIASAESSDDLVEIVQDAVYQNVLSRTMTEIVLERATTLKVYERLMQ